MTRLSTRVTSNTNTPALVATGLGGSIIGQIFDPPAINFSYRIQHKALVTCSDPKFYYSFTAAEVNSPTPIMLKVGIEQVRVDNCSVTSGSSIVSDSSITANDLYRIVNGPGIPANSYVGIVTPGVSFRLSSSQTTFVSVNATATNSSASINIWTSYQATFNGRQSTLVDPGGSVWTDPVAGLDLAQGEIFYTRPYEQTAAQVVALVNGSNISVGATTFTIDTMPAITSGQFRLTNNVSGSTSETVQVVSITGTSSPYTVTLANGVKYAHSVGDRFGGAVFTNGYVYSRENSSSVQADYSTSGTFSTISPATATLSTAANAGDTTLMVSSNGFGLNFTLDTSTNQESLTMLNSASTSGPYVYKLTTPLTKAHASGTTITGSLGYSAGLRPAAISATKYVGSRPPGVILVHNSIGAGTAPYTAPLDSYFTYAFTQNLAYINMARSGDNWGLFQVVQNSRGRRQLLSLGDWMYYGLGVNDSITFTLAQMQAGHTYMFNLARQHGLKIMAETLTPRSNSTDGWITTTNQTPYSSTAKSINDQFNDWIRSGAGGLVDAYVDIAQVTDYGLVQGSTPQGIWRADNGNNYACDGLHPSYIGHMTMSQAPVYLPGGTLLASKLSPAIFT